VSSRVRVMLSERECEPEKKRNPETRSRPEPNVVQILILASARIVCNIVYVQVRDRIHRELRCKN
jgi:hypothetical protein